MDIVIALTNNDASNLVICAKKQFNAKSTYTIVNDPKNISLFNELGVDKCINITTIITELIEKS